ncbi:MAG TPA: hypothetical protein VH092_12570 [Urbifossiella sp.]|jgi:hypothetical protein|nr:hypothetical protein [Urbifossiella sp.]
MAKKKGKKDADRPAKSSAPRRTEPVYTLITFVTFVAMAIGCTLLYLDFDEYGQQSPPKENAPTLPKLDGDAKTAPVAAPKAAD